MLLTSVNGVQKGYWYKDGYIRTSSVIYNTQNIANKFIHLTNDAVQKYGGGYGKYEDGNKVSFFEFQKYLDNNYADKGLNFYDDIASQMKVLATHAIKAVYGKIDPFKQQHCFEVCFSKILIQDFNRNFQLFGLDFMIDRNFKVWLIEINTNPCLETSSPILMRLIPTIVENTFRYLLSNTLI